MSKMMFEAFTKELFASQIETRNFMIYYKYEGMKKCYPLVADVEQRVNIDPEKKIESVAGIPLYLHVRDLRIWFHLMDEFIQNDPTLKIMIVDNKRYADEKTVMAVGKNGHWNIRAQYAPALRKVLVGQIQSSVKLAYAC